MLRVAPDSESIMIYMTEEVPAEEALSDVRRHQWDATPEDRTGDDQ